MKNLFVIIGFDPCSYNAIKNGNIKRVPTVERLRDSSAPDANNSSALQFTRRADIAPENMRRCLAKSMIRRRRFTRGANSASGLKNMKTPVGGLEYLRKNQNRNATTNQPANPSENLAISLRLATPGLTDVVSNMARRAIFRRMNGTMAIAVR